MHGDNDQVVPFHDAGPLSVKLVQNGTLKSYQGYPHGMITTQHEVINRDLLEWLGPESPAEPGGPSRRGPPLPVTWQFVRAILAEAVA